MILRVLTTKALVAIAIALSALVSLVAYTMHRDRANEPGAGYRRHIQQHERKPLGADRLGKDWLP